MFAKYVKFVKNMENFEALEKRLQKKFDVAVVESDYRDYDGGIVFFNPYILVWKKGEDSPTWAFFLEKMEQDTIYW